MAAVPSALTTPVAVHRQGTLVAAVGAPPAWQARRPSDRSGHGSTGRLKRLGHLSRCQEPLPDQCRMARLPQISLRRAALPYRPVTPGWSRRKGSFLPRSHRGDASASSGHAAPCSAHLTASLGGGGGGKGIPIPVITSRIARRSTATCSAEWRSTPCSASRSMVAIAFRKLVARPARGGNRGSRNGSAYCRVHRCSASGVSARSRSRAGPHRIMPKKLSPSLIAWALAAAG